MDTRRESGLWFNRLLTYYRLLTYSRHNNVSLIDDLRPKEKRIWRPNTE